MTNALRTFPTDQATVHRMKRPKMSVSKMCHARRCGVQAMSRPAPQRARSA